MRNLLMVCPVLFALVAQVAGAEGFSPPTEIELKRLPAFCTVKMREHSGDREALRRGIAMIGPQFQNAHHYCNGVNFLNRYYRAPFSAGAGSNLAMARNELDYMVDHMTPGSSIAGEIFLYRGIVNSLMKKDAEAVTDLQQAIARDPTLFRAYLTLADFYNERKQREKALEVVTNGLRNTPDSKGLKRRYKELGGKLPYPEPVVAQPQPKAAPEQPAPEAPAETGTQAAAVSPTQEPAVDIAAEKEAATESTPKKEWCRFCPDQP